MFCNLAIILFNRILYSLAWRWYKTVFDGNSYFRILTPSMSVSRSYQLSPSSETQLSEVCVRWSGTNDLMLTTFFIGKFSDYLFILIQLNLPIYYIGNFNSSVVSKSIKLQVWTLLSIKLLWFRLIQCWWPTNKCTNEFLKNRTKVKLDN